jgi:hypothetical protein
VEVFDPAYTRGYSDMSKSKLHCDWRSVSQSWYRAPSGAHDQIFITCAIVSLVFLGCPLWREVGSVFLCAAGPCQRCISRVWVPWDSRPYFTVSDLRPPFWSPVTTRKVTVEVFYPDSTRVYSDKSKSKLYYDRRSAGQSVLKKRTHLELTTRFWLLSDSCGFVGLGRPLYWEDGSVVCNCYWPSPEQSFLGPSPVGLAAIFYCLKFETYLFVASYDWQGHGGHIRPRLHTGLLWQLTLLPMK